MEPRYGIELFGQLILRLARTTLAALGIGFGVLLAIRDSQPWNVYQAVKDNDFEGLRVKHSPCPVRPDLSGYPD